jgi:hypothetical protein
MCRHSVMWVLEVEEEVVVVKVIVVECASEGKD